MPFPYIFAGQKLTASLLNQGLWTYTVKAGTTSRNTTVTSADDPDLSGIALPVGVVHVRARLFAYASSTTPNIRVAWAFTGTLSGFRSGSGPGNASTDPANGTARSTGAAYSSDVVYSLASSNFHRIEEEGILTVTAPGNLSVKWAQGTSSGANTSVAGSSFVSWLQIG